MRRHVEAPEPQTDAERSHRGWRRFIRGALLLGVAVIGTVAALSIADGGATGTDVSKQVAMDKGERQTDEAALGIGLASGVLAIAGVVVMIDGALEVEEAGIHMREAQDTTTTVQPTES